MKLGENLNQSFDAVFVRNVKESTERYDNFVRYADQIGLKFQRFEAINGSKYFPDENTLKPSMNPSQYQNGSHKYILGNHYTLISLILHAMANDYESIVTCDDDTEFLDIDIDLIKPHLPDDWDMVQLGSWDGSNKNDFGIIPLDSRSTRGSHCCAIHKRAYYKLLIELEQQNKTGDGLFQDMIESGRLKFYQLCPDITIQNRGELIPYSYDNKSLKF